MKKLLQYSLLAIAPLLIFSCQDDDSETGAPLVGKWRGDRSEVRVTYGIVTLHNETDEEFNVVLEFKEDGTAAFTKDGTTTTGTYELDGDQLTTNLDFQLQDVELSNVTFDVVELSETKLKIYLQRNQEVEVPDIGMVTTTVKGNFDFDRL